MPDPYQPDAGEEQQRAEAAKFSEKFCDPEKPSHYRYYGRNALTSVYGDELYRLSRIKFAE